MKLWLSYARGLIVHGTYEVFAPEVPVTNEHIVALKASLLTAARTDSESDIEKCLKELFEAREARVKHLFGEARLLEQTLLLKKINILREAWAIAAEAGGFIKEGCEAKEELVISERAAANLAQELLNIAASCSNLDQKVEQLVQALCLAQSAGDVGIALVKALEEALNVAKK